jgi:hypothetical protein
MPKYYMREITGYADFSRQWEEYLRIINPPTKGQLFGLPYKAG